MELYIFIVHIKSNGELYGIKRYAQSSRYKKKVTLEQIEHLDREITKRVKFKPREIYKDKPVVLLTCTFPLRFRKVAENLSKELFHAYQDAFYSSGLKNNSKKSTFILYL